MVVPGILLLVLAGLVIYYAVSSEEKGTSLSAFKASLNTEGSVATSYGPQEVRLVHVELSFGNVLSLATQFFFASLVLSLILGAVIGIVFVILRVMSA